MRESQFRSLRLPFVGSLSPDARSVIVVGSAPLPRRVVVRNSSGAFNALLSFEPSELQMSSDVTDNFVGFGFVIPPLRRLPIVIGPGQILYGGTDSPTSIQVTVAISSAFHWDGTP